MEDKKIIIHSVSDINNESGYGNHLLRQRIDLLDGVHHPFSEVPLSAFVQRSGYEYIKPIRRPLKVGENFEFLPLP